MTAGLSVRLFVRGDAAKAIEGDIGEGAPAEVNVLDNISFPWGAV